MRINEIFYSLQGEGHFTGHAAVFLRFSGCNTRCPFCDTDHFSYTEMTTEEVMQAIATYPTRHIVITGGEPMMQMSGELTDALHKAGYFIQIETNGSLPIPSGCSIDWVTCSPKDLPIKIQQIDELKVLFPCDSIESYDATKAQEYRLQPLDTGDATRNKEIVNETINYILKHPKWHLSLQTHKILNVR